jgi:glycine hydroxymethyltransferase
MDDYLFREELDELDPAVARLIGLEAERQARKLILIPSESYTPRAVRQALGSVFTNIYAEGYPMPETRWMDEERILDYESHMAFYRRYGDLRYYMGVEYADVAEALARRRCAEAFATADLSADRIYVNVQPLSGAAANVAVYEALLKPNDTIMGLDLTHGGHLTHGSPANVSGRRYKAVFYTVDPRTELLDYEQIEQLALEHRPKIIVAGYTSYPRLPDWARFRQIADQVGAYLLADIAHVAGMVVAGAYPTPLGYADVITFTTHKTLCGPRGACILTTDPLLSRRIDHAVFPGLQGGPHVNKFVAMAVAFRIAVSAEFRALQHQIVANARALAERVAPRRGCACPTAAPTVISCWSTARPCAGRSASRCWATPLPACSTWWASSATATPSPAIDSPALASGIRLGTPWVTQRGFKPARDAVNWPISSPRRCKAVDALHLSGSTRPRLPRQGGLRRAGGGPPGGSRELAARGGYRTMPVSLQRLPAPLPGQLTLRPPQGEWGLVELEGNAVATFLDHGAGGG